MPRKKKVVTEVVQEVQAAPELPIVEEVKAPKFNAEDVVVCPKCGTKTFFNKGKCKWCYKSLEGAEKVQ